MKTLLNWIFGPRGILIVPPGSEKESNQILADDGRILVLTCDGVTHPYYIKL